MNTKYNQIVDVTQIGRCSKVDMNAIFTMAGQEQFTPSIYDPIRRLLLCIDVQNDFMEGGALAVPGSIGDVERITRFIYNNMGGISRIMCSLDTHIAYQIFHPCWWKDPAGNHPDPYTTITYDDIKKGYWYPVTNNPKESIDYVKNLEMLGKKQLCIWPYHCIKGTEGNALESEFAKMVHYHSAARNCVNQIVPKGEDRYSEMYGIIKPEYSKNNFLNTLVLTAIERYDEIYVVGEAASHCLMESVKQIAEHFSDRPEVTQKITILEDCTSPITGFEADTAAAFDNFKNFYGIKFAKSTDIQF